MQARLKQAVYDWQVVHEQSVLVFSSLANTVGRLQGISAKGGEGDDLGVLVHFTQVNERLVAKHVEYIELLLKELRKQLCALCFVLFMLLIMCAERSLMRWL